MVTALCARAKGKSLGFGLRHLPAEKAEHLPASVQFVHRMISYVCFIFVLLSLYCSFCALTCIVLFRRSGRRSAGASDAESMRGGFLGV